MEPQECQFQTVSTGEFTPIHCAHYCAHAHSKWGTIQPTWIAIGEFHPARKRILYSDL